MLEGKAAPSLVEEKSAGWTGNQLEQLLIPIYTNTAQAFPAIYTRYPEAHLTSKSMAMLPQFRA